MKDHILKFNSEKYTLNKKRSNSKTELDIKRKNERLGVFENMNFMRVKNEDLIKRNLSKYNSDETHYNIKVINDLMYDEKKHIVSVFKEFLILDDIAEFLDDYYYFSDSRRKLKRIVKEYDERLITKPIYARLDCLKILQKNIKRHKKLIDQIEEYMNRNSIRTEYSKIVRTELMDSILTHNTEKSEIYEISKFDKIVMGNTSLDYSVFHHFKSLTKIFNTQKELPISKITERDLINKMVKKDIHYEKKTVNNINMNSIDNLLKKIKSTNQLKKDKHDVNNQNSNNPSQTKTIKLNNNRIEIKKLDLASIISKKETISNNSINKSSNKKKLQTTRNENTKGISNFNTINNNTNVKSIYNINVNLNLNLNLLEKGNHTDRQHKSINRNKILKACTKETNIKNPLTDRNSISENNLSNNPSYSKSNINYKKFPLSTKKNDYTDKSFKSQKPYNQKLSRNVKNLIFNETQVKRTKPVILELNNINLFKSIKVKGQNKNVISVSPKINKKENNFNLYFKRYIAAYNIQTPNNESNLSKSKNISKQRSSNSKNNVEYNSNAGSRTERGKSSKYILKY